MVEGRPDGADVSEDRRPTEVAEHVDQAGRGRLPAVGLQYLDVNKMQIILPKDDFPNVVRVFSPHMGADFFPEGGKNTSKFVVPPKMALGEGIVFPFVGEE